jgi:hypothetical protein
VDDLQAQLRALQLENAKLQKNWITKLYMCTIIHHLCHDVHIKNDMHTSSKSIYLLSYYAYHTCGVHIYTYMYMYYGLYMWGSMNIVLKGTDGTVQRKRNEN